MGQIMKLEGNWWLRQAKSGELKDDRLIPGIFDEDPSGAAGWYDSEKALSVHEILIEHQVPDEGIKAGECESSIWVAESDWLYHHKDFNAPEKRDGSVRLVFKGLDTVVADRNIRGRMHGSIRQSLYCGCGPGRKIRRMV